MNVETVEERRVWHLLLSLAAVGRLPRHTDSTYDLHLYVGAT